MQKFQCILNADPKLKLIDIGLETPNTEGTVANVSIERIINDDG